MYRAATGGNRAFQKLNENLASSLLQLQLRSLSASTAGGDTYNASDQALVQQDYANPSAPFTTIAQFDLDAGSWVICATTTIKNGAPATAPPAAFDTWVEVTCRIRVGPDVLVSVDHADPVWNALVATYYIGINLAPAARATLEAPSTVTLEARVSSPAVAFSLPNSKAARTRLLASPY